MTTDLTARDWTEQFAGLANLPDRLRARLRRDARRMRFPAGTTLFGPGRRPDGLIFLTEGVVRVFQTSDTGREIVLYRVEAGESCVMTTACLLAHEAYSAEGVAETDVEAVALPRASFDALMADAPEFREFVFGAYTRRITDLFRVIDEVAFGRMDIRLAGRLVALANGRETLAITHQGLATELGTAREVISRQLTEFQRRGWIEQGRGAIRILDEAALRGLGAH